MTNLELDTRIANLIGKKLYLFSELKSSYVMNTQACLVEWRPSEDWHQGGPVLYKYKADLGPVPTETAPRIFTATCRGANGEGATFLIAGLMAVLAAEERDNPQTSFTETSHVQQP